MYSALAPTLTRRAAQRNALVNDLLLVLAGSLFVALMAQVSVPLPFTPVPLTGQTFAVLLVGAALGSKRGAASLALYALEGVGGLPVFAGGAVGLGRLLGPTGGYLLGFVAAAFIIGLLAERGLDRSWRTSLLPFLIGTAIIYAFGVCWLAAFIGFEKALAGGLYPFLIGDTIKLIFAATALPAAWALAHRFEE